MANTEITLGQLKTLAGGIIHADFNKYRKTGPTNQSMGIYKDDIFAGPIRLIDGGKNLRSGKFEIGEPPEPKLWLRMLG